MVEAVVGGRSVSGCPSKYDPERLSIRFQDVYYIFSQISSPAEISFTAGIFMLFPLHYEMAFWPKKMERQAITLAVFGLGKIFSYAGGTVYQ